MIRLTAQDDLVIAFAEGDADGLALPEDLAPEIAAALSSRSAAQQRAGLARLRVVAGVVVDAATITQWFADPAGRLRAVQLDPAWAEIPGASWDSRLVRTGSGWRLRVAADDLADHARDLRWRVEVGGTTAAGIPVATDDRAKVMIIGGRAAAVADPQWSTVWQGADGNAYPVDAAAMIAISEAVQAHVNASFATLATVLAAIEAGTIGTIAAVDAAFAEA